MPSEFRPLDLEVAAHPNLMTLKVGETAIAGFALALNQKIGVLAVLAFRKRDFEVLTTGTCD
jgi:hypothetical protein